MYRPLFEQHPKCITCKESRQLDDDMYHINQIQAVSWWTCSEWDIEIHDPYQMYCSEWSEIPKKGGKHEHPKV